MCSLGIAARRGERDEVVGKSAFSKTDTVNLYKCVQSVVASTSTVSIHVLSLLLFWREVLCDVFPFLSFGI